MYTHWRFIVVDYLSYSLKSHVYPSGARIIDCDARYSFSHSEQSTGRGEGGSRRAEGGGTRVPIQGSALLSKYRILNSRNPHKEFSDSSPRIIR